MNRHSRQTILPEIGRRGQLRHGWRDEACGGALRFASGANGAVRAARIAPDDVVIDLPRGDPLPPPAPDRRVVFLCVTGLRAWHAARALADAGHKRVAIRAAGDTG